MMSMVTADNEPLPLIEAMANMIANTMAVSIVNDDAQELLTSLVVMVHRLGDAWHQDSMAMDDDTLELDVELLDDDQIERLRAQGAKVAVQALVDELAHGMGVTIEVQETEQRFKTQGGT